MNRYSLRTKFDGLWIALPNNGGEVGDMSDITCELNRLLENYEVAIDERDAAQAENEILRSNKLSDPLLEVTLKHIIAERDAAIAERDNALTDWRQADTDSIRALHERNEAREKLSEWSILNAWGGTPEIINEFIKGQQTRIHHAQSVEEELTAAIAERDAMRAEANKYIQLWDKATKELETLKFGSVKDQIEESPRCSCAKCNKKAWWMTVCSICGNKRCPHAANHMNQCTNSNEPNQPTNQ